jgi:hypothetical protein
VHSRWHPWENGKPRRFEKTLIVGYVREAERVRLSEIGKCREYSQCRFIQFTLFIHLLLLHTCIALLFINMRKTSANTRHHWFSKRCARRGGQEDAEEGAERVAEGEGTKFVTKAREIRIICE